MPLGIKDPQGLAFDSGSGVCLFWMQCNSQIVSVAPHPTLGFDANEAIRSNKVQRISLKKLGLDRSKDWLITRAMDICMYPSLGRRNYMS